MCFSEKVLKWAIYTSSVIILGIGSVLIWVGYLVQASPFIEILSFSYAGYVVVCCGGFLIFLCFLGLVGAWKKKKLLLGFFVALNISVCVLLICFGGILIYLRTVSDDFLKDEINCLKNYQKIDTASVSASKVFCTIYCPCSLDAVLLNISLPIDYRGSADSMLQCDPCETISTYSVSEQNQVINWLRNQMGFNVTADECQVLSSDYQNTYFQKDLIKYIPLITWIEKRFICSGLCTSNPILYFSNVNLGKPLGPCYSDLRDWANSNFTMYGVISIVLGFFQLIVISFASSLCCCPKRINLTRVEEPHIEGDLNTSQGIVNSKQLDTKKNVPTIQFEKETNENVSNSIQINMKGKLRTPFSRKHFLNN